VTWSYGDGDEAFREIASRKVSLDPYRLQSRKILATIKEFLPADVQKVEKASIDEVFLDLSAQVHAIMLERYPELKGPPPYDDPSEPLVRPPTTALDWAADALVDLDKEQSEEDDPDWDDVAILIASEIVRDVRAEIYKKLHFTCSAGISKNKMLAKLGSAHKKPNSQTVIRNRAVQHFLSDFKFTKIRNLGGKLGDEIVAAFNTDTVAELLPVPIEQFKKTLSEDTGSWLYNIIRGEDNSEVNPRTQIKSMLSAKSFRPSINTLDVACKWLRIFVADIYSRLVEEGVLENKRRPKTINLHHRQGAQTRSKSSPIPLGRAITEEGMFDLAKSLLAQCVVEGRAWPCANLSLSVGGFEEGVQGNQGIGGFLVRGEDAKALQNAQPKSEATPPPPAKRRRVDGGGGITRFFGMREDSRDSSGGGGDLGSSDYEQMQETPQHTSHDNTVITTTPAPAPAPARAKPLFFSTENVDIKNNDPDPLQPPPSAQTTPLPNPSLKEAPPSSPLPFDYDTTITPPLGDEEAEQDPDPDSSSIYTCPRCKETFPVEGKLEHEDFHFAQDLQKDEQSTPLPPRPVPPASASSGRPPASATPGGASRGGAGGTQKRGRGRPSALSGGPERGQKRLNF
jgi:DNA polymerase eta